MILEKLDKKRESEIVRHYLRFTRQHVALLVILDDLGMTIHSLDGLELGLVGQVTRLLLLFVRVCRGGIPSRSASKP